MNKSIPIFEWAVKEVNLCEPPRPVQSMTPFVRTLLVRNMYQILGIDGKSPVDFVLLWTPTEDPCDENAGGTRYAARCARRHGIPVYHLGNADVQARLAKMVKSVR